MVYQRVFHVHVRRMCVLLLCTSSIPLFLDVLPIIESKVTKSPTILLTRYLLLNIFQVL